MLPDLLTVTLLLPVFATRLITAVVLVSSNSSSFFHSSTVGASDLYLSRCHMQLYQYLTGSSVRFMIQCVAFCGADT